MTLVTNQQPIVAFPADVWEKATSKEELVNWLNKCRGNSRRMDRNR